MSRSVQIADKPVFVVGSARSGTTLLYHTLLASGEFAVYRGEPAVFDLLAPKFGDLGVLDNRKNLLRVWLRSKMFRACGLECGHIERLVLSQCKGSGDFLKIVMREVARSQGVKRWAVWGPDNLLQIRQIKKELPHALFIHMIRDGRDVAVSLREEGWIRPFPWDKERSLLVAALHWRWKVSRGREYGQAAMPDYLEVRYEDLVANPVETLARVSEFVECDLEYARIRRNPIGTLSATNSSFTSGNPGPIGRWKHLLSPAEAALLESALGPLLVELGYSVATTQNKASGVELRLKQTLYSSFFDAKHWCKTKTPLGKFVATERMRLEQPAL